MAIDANGGNIENLFLIICRLVRRRIVPWDREQRSKVAAGRDPKGAADTCLRADVVNMFFLSRFMIKVAFSFSFEFNLLQIKIHKLARIPI